MSVTERRRRLLDAALEVVSREGVANATTRAITAEAGMPRGMFHYCFDSKDQLLEMLIERHVADMANAGRAEWRDDRSLADNLAAGLQAFLRTGSANPREELLSYELTVYALRSDSPEMAATLYANYARQATDYLEFLADRAGVRWTVPLPTAARTLATIIDGSMLYWLADHDLDATRAALDGFAVLVTHWAEPLPTAHGIPTLPVEPTSVHKPSHESLSAESRT
jgi:AcrR family transcriptional regulator